MVVPRPFFDPTAAAAAGCFSLSEPFGSQLYRWTRPCFSKPFMRGAAAHPREVLNQRPNSSPDLSLGPFLARFWRSEAAPNSGQTNPSPVASAGGRSVNLE